MTYRSISSEEYATGKPGTTTLVSALVNNPIAIAEAAKGAPVVFGAWHPYNQLTYGDEVDGLIYDFDADGTASYVETPDFENGYEYALYVHGLSTSTVATPTVSIFEQTGGAELTALTFSAGGSIFDTMFGMIQFFVPRLRVDTHIVKSECLWAGADNIKIGSASSLTTRISKARLNLTNIDAGKVYMLRRRNELSA